MDKIMKSFLVMALVFTIHNAWADISVQVIDENHQPVSNAVITLPNHEQKTPDSIAVMDQVNVQFSPRVLVIQKGQTVSFPNNDDIRHNVYSFSAPKAFQIKLYKGNSTAPILFDKPGLVVLGCNIHDDMIGYIYVANHEFVIKTDKNGKATLPANAGDRVNIWDENLSSTINSKKTLVLGEEASQTIMLDLLPSVKQAEHKHATSFGKKF